MRVSDQTIRLLLPIVVLLWMSLCRADDQLRPAHDDDELRVWLENMVWHHRYARAEIEQVTGLSESQLNERLRQFNISDGNRPPRSDKRLLLLPYPGGRHPRIGFQDCEPGKTQHLRGWLSFFQGEDIQPELKRIEATGWRTAAAGDGAAFEPKSSDAVEAALQRAGENRDEIERALRDVPFEQRDGMLFLIENMPDRDLESLSAEFLLENSAMTWKALGETPWAKDVPQDVAFDCLLPYANVSESRDRWRKDFYDRFRPLVANAAAPAEAAAILNQAIFPTLNVKYSTGRKKADQSPFESMESGLASCTGLSVILVDACRSVGVPARIAGTPLWSDKSGNHTWVEIWDNGWHFTGACEPTGSKLNEGWFIDRASQAKRDDHRHAIYAVTFRKNGQPMPMVWAQDVHDVFAVNVTDRYTGLRKEIPAGHAIVRFRTTIEGSGKRISVPLEVKDAAGKIVFEGSTNDERFDANDHLSATLPIDTEFVCEIAFNGAKVPESFTVRAGEQLISISVTDKK